MVYSLSEKELKGPEDKNRGPAAVFCGAQVRFHNSGIRIEGGYVTYGRFLVRKFNLLGDHAGYAPAGQPGRVAAVTAGHDHQDIVS